MPGCFPTATEGIRDAQLSRALGERSTAIERRASSVLRQDMKARAAWLRQLPPAPGTVDPTDLAQWLAVARAVAAYRDRWQITGDTALGTKPVRDSGFSQQADYRHATLALNILRSTARRAASVAETAEAPSRRAGIQL